MVITSKEIRDMFLCYFNNRNHIIKKSSSLVPKNNKSLLFTNSGMVQFKDYFLGIKKSKDNFVSIQHCLRISGKHNDLENVGYTLKHNTFFEMMGNFSFGLYFKKDAIFYAWDLLTNNNFFSLSKDKFIVTVHKNDIESYNIWLNIIKLPKNRIFVLGDSSLDSENFWFINDFGLCGYSTEIFYDFYFDKKIDNNNLFFFKNNKRFIEVWNLVFMEFVLDSKFKFKKLSNKCIDTGMGFERIVSILQNVNSNFDIDIFIDIKLSISKILNIEINNNNLNIFNIISDHIRSIIYLIFYGILPSNEYRGYILRKLIRRVLLYIKFLNINNIILYKIVKFLLINNYEFKLLNINNINNIINIVLCEEKKFFKTLYYSLNLLDFYIKRIRNSKYLSSKIVFLLYDTYGLPINLLVDFCNYKGILVNLDKFKLRLKNHRNISKKNSDFFVFNKFDIILNFINKFVSTKFYGFKKKKIISKILFILNNKNYFKIKSKLNFSILLDKTVFFPKCSGQSGDKGFIKSLDNKSKFIVKKTIKLNNYIIHIGYFKYGNLLVNEKIKCVYNFDNRKLNSINHSCLHILCYVLNKNFINFIKNSSRINSKKLILDFSCDSYNNLNFLNIENEVNYIIWKNLNINEKLLLNKNLYNKFNFKFLGKNIVRLIYIDNIYNEYCSGTHINNTKYINLFIIKKIYNLSNGIKRLICLTSFNSLKYINKFKYILYDLCNNLNSNIKYIYNDILNIINKYKILKKYNKNLVSLYINNLIKFFNKKYIFIFKNFSILFYNKKNINFLDKNILFILLNNLYKKYNLSIIIISILLNNKKYYVILLNSLILKKLGFNFFDKLKFYFLNKKYLINNFYLFKNNRFYVSIFTMFKNININKCFLDKIFNFIKKVL